ncbi:MAG: tyrosine-type recombinase/integrase [Nitrospinae bacterium]|nr:tyrosine-type recombinase/integrase [Nitrospinota bacterium]
MTAATMTDHVTRFVAMKQKLGYRFTKNERILRNFARFAEERNEKFVHSGTVLEWVSDAPGVSRPVRVRKLHTLNAFARWMHAEDTRHEVPPPDALGPLCERRPPPCLVTAEEIGKLLAATLRTEPAGTLTPLTWHYLFGLIAVTGLRISEALALTFDDITPDGLIVRGAKFGKSRMVALHPTTRDALNRYLRVRRKAKTPDAHLFVLASTGRPPGRKFAARVFRRLAERTGIREPGAARGPTPHSLRHSFAVRSIESLGPDANPGRHMLALATYLGHTEVSDTYWYLEATPVLLRGIAEAMEQAHAVHRGGSHD